MGYRRIGSFGTILFTVGVVTGIIWHNVPLTSIHGDYRTQATETERENLYQQLQDEASFFERQGRVVGLASQLVRPAVVHIESKKPKLPSMGSGYIEEAGSGVIVQIEGNEYDFYVLTNSHVIHKAPTENITITLDDSRKTNPIRVWEDPESDVAVMQIAAPQLIGARLGDSRAVDIGQFVLAMGSPFGLSHSTTFGIISAKGRRGLELGNDQVEYQDFFQTDAAINPGNSGGPLVNLKGEVIGINAAIASNSGGNEGIGFSIPINMAMTIAEQLIEYGSPMRAFLGVELAPKFDIEDATRRGLPSPFGALITRIRPNTPADNSELKEGDIIIEYDSIPVDNDTHLINLVSLTRINTEVELVVWRNRQKMKLMVRVGDRSKLLGQQQ
ncbi:Periplasmic pH-dependent serine endoprotease DegQ [Planctomycetales bacterium 10988]|nr:Periplasmic pH-dependent serine endoprotease DegQ [Planctomycetales bacterium 10988]